MLTAMPRIAIATSDFEGIVGLFRDGLGMPVADISASSAEAEMLIDRGLNVLALMAGAGGRDVHPRSTHVSRTARLCGFPSLLAMLAGSVHSVRETTTFGEIDL